MCALIALQVAHARHVHMQINYEDQLSYILLNRGLFHCMSVRQTKPAIAKLSRLFFSSDSRFAKFKAKSNCSITTILIGIIVFVEIILRHRSPRRCTGLPELASLFRSVFRLDMKRLRRSHINRAVRSVAMSDKHAVCYSSIPTQ
jgi:hypothetical protein